MTIRPVNLISASLLCFALTASQCRNVKNDEGNLEELPQDIAVNLKRVPNTDLLISQPPLTIKQPKGPQPTFTPAFCALRETSLVQVIYPITICYPPVEPVVELLREHHDGKGSPAGQQSQPSQTRIFKLAGFQGETFLNARRCVQKFGPWLASITKEDPCFGPITFSLVILGVPPCPDCPGFDWFDDIDNHPPELGLIMPLMDTKGFSIDCNANDPTNCGNTPPPPPTPIP